MSDQLAPESVRRYNAWSPGDPIRPLRYEGQAWRSEFPYEPSTTIPGSEPRYSIPLPEIGIAFGDHGWPVNLPYRT